MTFSIIVAYSIPDRAIGNNGGLPWSYISEDMKRIDNGSSYI